MNIKFFEFAGKPFEATLVYKLESKSDLDKAAYKAIKGETSIFTDIELKGSDICFNISNSMSLKKYLNQALTKKEVLNILDSVIQSLCFIKDAGLRDKNLLLDVDLVLVDQDSLNISLIYLPVREHELRVKSYRGFLKEILVNMIYDESEDLSYVGSIITYINKTKDINMDAFLSYIQSLKGSSVRPAAKAMVVPEIASPRKEAPAPAVVEIPAPAPVKEPVDELSMDMDLAIPEIVPDEIPVPVSVPEPVAEVEPVVISVPEPVKEAEPVFVKAKPDKAEPVKPVVYPYIERDKTGEKLYIEKEEFMVGKIAGVADCLIADNPTVSRMHAIIKRINGIYYVCDNYSTNSSFLNGEKLEPGRDYLLVDGAKVYFANEGFVFHSK